MNLKALLGVALVAGMVSGMLAPPAAEAVLQPRTVFIEEFGFQL